MKLKPFALITDDVVSYMVAAEDLPEAVCLLFGLLDSDGETISALKVREVPEDEAKEMMVSHDGDDGATDVWTLTRDADWDGKGQLLGMSEAP